MENNQKATKSLYNNWKNDLNLENKYSIHVYKGFGKEKWKTLRNGKK